MMYLGPVYMAGEAPQVGDVTHSDSQQFTHIGKTGGGFIRNDDSEGNKNDVNKQKV